MKNYFAKDRYQPEGEWVQTTGMFEVAGTLHRTAAANAFAHGAANAETRRLKYGLELESEPTNKFDPNAIMVFGFYQTKNFFGGIKIERHFIGYVPAEVAADVKELADQGLPIAAELYDIKMGKKSPYINMFILAPRGHSHSSRMRRKSKLERQAA